MNVSGYCRVSTTEQAHEGYSLAAQEQAIRAYCQAQGWELLEVYADAGRSGKVSKGARSWRVSWRCEYQATAGIG